MIVTHRTTDGQAEPRLPRRLGAIARVKHEIFFINRTAFIAGDITTIETAANFLVARRVRQQVAGKISMVNSLNGMFALKALMTQSRYVHISR